VESLAYLEESHLKELGLSVGDRVKFKMSLDNVKRAAPAPTIGPSGNESPPNSLPTDSAKYAQSRPAPIPVHKRAPSEQNLSASSLPPVTPSKKSSSISTLGTSSPKVTPDRTKSNSTSSPARKSTVPAPVPSSPVSASVEPSTTCEEYQCKIVVIGPPTTGKTCLVRRFTYGTFDRVYKNTIGVDFEVKTVKWSDNILMHVQLWDIAGQERFTSVVPQFYRNAHAAIVVFDVSESETTLPIALRWNEHFQRHEIQNNGNNIPVMLIANKADLLSAEKGTQNYDALCKEQNLAKWALTSAKTNQGIDEAINFLIERILNDYGVNGKEQEKQLDTKLDLTKAVTKKQESGCCN